MTFYSTVLIISILLLIFLLYKEIFHPAATFMIVVSILIIFGVLKPEEALAGFSNEQIAIIALLIIISSILKDFKATYLLFRKFLKENLTYRSFLLRLMTTVSISSAFINNTPIVATFIPHVFHWGKRKNIPPSKLLIPLSYAAILGGTLTLIGTSTNLVINGLTIKAGYKPFHLLDFSKIGFFTVSAGIVYMLTIGYRLLPERKDAISSFIEKKRRYLIETFIPSGSPLAGKTVKEANLRNLPGLFLVEILRKDEKITPVSPEDKIKENDILIFAGDTEKIVELIENFNGISLPEVCSLNREKLELVEALIPFNSSLIGKKVKETNFRAKFDAAIVAVHRNGENLHGKIGEIILQPGDLLILITGKDFWEMVSESDDIYVINKLSEISTEEEEKKAVLILAGFILAILLSAIKIIPIFNSLLILISLLVIFKIAPYIKIKKSFDLNLIIIAALSIAIGKAMLTTGLADQIATFTTHFSKPFGILGALIILYLITNILTEFVTNLAAASISFPIAISISKELAVNPKGLILLVAFAASASFITPIGYQTNLMVYGPGNYKFKDFLKVGLPLSILYMITVITAIKLQYF